MVVGRARKAADQGLELGPVDRDLVVPTAARELLDATVGEIHDPILPHVRSSILHPGRGRGAGSRRRAPQIDERACVGPTTQA